MGKKEFIIPDLGLEFGRPDMERIGFFAEMGYLVGKKYSPPLIHSEIRDLKKRQMFPGAPKWKTGLQDCYFDQDFKRLFIGEGYPRKRKDDSKKKQPEPKIVRPFIPSKHPNPLYHPGDAYGYFNYLEAFSPKMKKGSKAVKQPRGIFTNPGKLGGPGYVDICLNGYPEHLPDKYTPTSKPDKEKKKYAPIRAGQQPDFFDPNPFLESDPKPPYKKMKEVYLGKIGPKFRPSSPAKWDGGCKDGTFEVFPVYVEDRYHDPHRIDKVLTKMKEAKNKKKKLKPGRVNPVFRPSACCRTWQSPSVMARRAEIATNEYNWTEMKPVTFTQKIQIL